MITDVQLKLRQSRNKAAEFSVTELRPLRRVPFDGKTRVSFVISADVKTNCQY